MAKSKEIKMNYEQAKQLASYLEHTRKNIDTVVNSFKNKLSSYNKVATESRTVHEGIEDYLRASIDVNNQTIETLTLIEQVLLNSNDKEKVDEIFSGK